MKWIQIIMNCIIFNSLFKLFSLENITKLITAHSPFRSPVINQAENVLLLGYFVLSRDETCLFLDLQGANVCTGIMSLKACLLLSWKQL